MRAEFGQDKESQTAISLISFGYLKIVHNQTSFYNNKPYFIRLPVPFFIHLVPGEHMKYYIENDSHTVIVGFCIQI